MTGAGVRRERPAATVELLYEGEVVLVQSDDVVVGRTAKCTVRVVHPLVSREHCRLEPRADGLFVVDLEAVNGTWLNGARVVGRAQARAGDRLGLGREGAVLVVRRALVDGVDVSRMAREEDQKTMVAGDPRAAGAVARVEIAPGATPAFRADEPTTRAANEAEKAAAWAESSIPVASVLQTTEIGDEPPETAETAPAAAAAGRGFAPGFAVGVAIGLATVAALATFTHALDGVRARPAEVRPR